MALWARICSSLGVRWTRSRRLGVRMVRYCVWVFIARKDNSLPSCRHHRKTRRPTITRQSRGLRPPVDVHHGSEELERLRAGALEGVATHDAAEAAAGCDARTSWSSSFGVLRLAAGEDHDALAVERALHHVPHAVGQGLRRDRVLLEDLLGLGLLDVVLRRLDLDDVRAELAGDLRRVGDDVDRRLALLARCPRRADTPRRPSEGRTSFASSDELAEFFVHRVAGARARIDRVADRRAAEAHRVLHARRHRADRLLHLGERVGVVQLENERDLPGELVGGRLERAERRGVGVAARVDGQLEVVVGVVAAGLGANERAGPCSKPWSTGKMTNLPVPASAP